MHNATGEMYAAQQHQLGGGESNGDPIVRLMITKSCITRALHNSKHWFYAKDIFRYVSKVKFEKFKCNIMNIANRIKSTMFISIIQNIFYVHTYMLQEYSVANGNWSKFFFGSTFQGLS